MPYDHRVPDVRAEALRAILDQTYSPSDHPALIWQTEQWHVNRPLAGNRIADATPVFHNTLAKYVPLLAAGADLTIVLSPLLPHDPNTVTLLHQVGIPVTTRTADRHDVALDCAGILAQTPVRVGYVELTKSGQHVYESSTAPVFLADDSRVKLIETVLGTGDGFVRGLAHFGHPDLNGREIVVFGCGKVGRGAALAALAAGASVTLVDPDTDARPPDGCSLIDAADTTAVRAALDSAWCVASATGIAGALGPWAEYLAGSDLVLANLGAEDEFGPDMPEARVLNDKAPVNFALAEPTHLRYIDATMALHNAGAVELLTGSYRPGIQRPPRAVEDDILDVVHHCGTIELSTIEEDLL